MEKIKKRIGFDEVFVVDSMGRAGGMGFFWEQEGAVIKVVATAFIVKVLIRNHKLDTYWWCIGVYASTNDRI